MSTPHAKRRRLNDAAKTLQKPFKSPFRTPLKPNIGSDPPSSDPAELRTPLPLSLHVATPTGIAQSDPSPAAGTCAKRPPSASTPSVPRVSKPSPSLSKKTPSKPSLAREIVQLRNEIQMLTQAQSLATSAQDDHLVVLIDRWRTASRAAAEELFGSTRDRVNRMGGVGAWKERENEAKDRQKKWDQEEMEAEREKVEEAKANGEISDEAYDRYAEMDDDNVKPEEEKETFKAADDDSFTMDMMLKTLNIDLKLIGYNKDAQRWDG